eukprot:m.11305 g.11305  ORF g.11305 m.11305 type:complete len:187 (-) comp5694_c0_seq1:2038-2598(-)
MKSHLLVLIALAACFAAVLAAPRNKKDGLRQSKKGNWLCHHRSMAKYVLNTLVINDRVTLSDIHCDQIDRKNRVECIVGEGAATAILRCEPSNKLKQYKNHNNAIKVVFAEGFTTPADPFCASNPCQNGGTCAAGVCICQTGIYTGTVCETPICALACLNGGTCTGPGFCTCPSGFSGIQCQTDNN